MSRQSDMPCQSDLTCQSNMSHKSDMSRQADVNSHSSIAPELTVDEVTVEKVPSVTIVATNKNLKQESEENTTAGELISPVLAIILQKQFLPK